MLAKLVTVTLMLVVTAGGVLLLRQERLELAHEIANLHSELVETRMEIWEAKAQAAKLVRPGDLQLRINSIRVAMEPAYKAPEAGSDDSSSSHRTVPVRN